MTALSSLLRLTLVLVLAASPLVSSAMAAGDGEWSRMWADPLSGTPQAAEEEEPAGHSDLAEVSVKAVEWSVPATERLGADAPRPDACTRPPAPPLLGDPTPPPEGA